MRDMILGKHFTQVKTVPSKDIFSETRGKGLKNLVHYIRLVGSLAKDWRVNIFYRYVLARRIVSSTLATDRTPRNYGLFPLSFSFVGRIFQTVHVDFIRNTAFVFDFENNWIKHRFALGAVNIITVICLVVGSCLSFAFIFGIENRIWFFQSFDIDININETGYVCVKI